MKKLFFVFVLVVCSHLLFGKDFSIAVVVKNQPNNMVILGKVLGDNFLPMDSLLAENEMIRFQVNENISPAVLRLVMGQTAESKINNEDPQQLDFIFNAEDVVLKTEFNAPIEKLEILESKENAIWYDFLARDNVLIQGITILEREMDKFWEKKDTASAVATAGEFNQLQMERNMFIDEIVKENDGYFVAKLISLNKMPVMDGYLDARERKEQLKKQFFDALDFQDENLIYSRAYSDKIFDFLVLFNQPGLTEQERIEAYKRAVDTVMEHLSTNKKVRDFALNYMIHGFQVLQMESVIEHVNSYRF